MEAQHPHPPGHEGHDHSNRPDWFNQIDQFLNTWDDTVDRYHQYRFEYHAPPHGQHLMIAIDDSQGHRECHFVEISDQWEPLLNQTATIPKVSEEIYALITSNNAPETQMSIRALEGAYGDHDATRECYGHSIWILNYTPSSTLQAMLPAST